MAPQPPPMGGSKVVVPFTSSLFQNPCPRKRDVIDTLAISFDGNKDISNKLIPDVQSPEEYRSLCQRPIHQTIESVATMFRPQQRGSSNSNNNSSSSSHKPKVRFGGTSISNNSRRNSIFRGNNNKQQEGTVSMMSNNTHNKNNTTTTSLLSKKKQQHPKNNASLTTNHHPQQQQPPSQRPLLQPSSSSSNENNRNNNDTILSSGFSSMEIEELKQSFDLFDVEGTGKVPIQTILRVLKDLQELEENITTTIGQHHQRSKIYPNLQQLIDILSTVAEAEKNSNNKSTTIDGAEEENENNVVSLEFQDYLRLMEMTTINYKLSSPSSSEDDYHNILLGDDDQNNSNSNTINKLVYVFDLFDIDSKGYITLGDLERIALELGESTMTRDELADMIDRASALVSSSSNNNNSAQVESGEEAGEGRVTLEAFIKMMTYDLFPKKQQQQVEEEDVASTTKAEF